MVGTLIEGIANALMEFEVYVGKPAINYNIIINGENS